jgi:hypothetical protein
MTQLMQYDIVKQGLAQLVCIDEVREVMNKAEAMIEYARRANDKELIENAISGKA